MNSRKLKVGRGKSGLAVLAAICFTVTSCGSNNADQISPEYGDSVEGWNGTEVKVPDGYELFEWDTLLPPGVSGDEIYARYEDRLSAVEDASPEADALYEEMQAEYQVEGAVVNTELDGKKIHMAGFVSPLSFEEDTITEFLFVPYFGACIHVPAPPPNQTIMVRLEDGNSMDLEDTWGAVWVSGDLTAVSEDTELATAGYTITEAKSTVYESF